MFEPDLKPTEARRLARELLVEGKIIYTGHALDEMLKDDLEAKDIELALRGMCEEGEWENQEWRYRFHSLNVWAVVAFRNDELVVIVTAWRKQQR